MGGSDSQTAHFLAFHHKHRTVIFNNDNTADTCSSGSGGSGSGSGSASGK